MPRAITAPTTNRPKFQRLEVLIRPKPLGTGNSDILFENVKHGSKTIEEINYAENYIRIGDDKFKKKSAQIFKCQN